ncbi:transglutaminase domain-containing protein [Paenibacillus sp. OV219]|uniref:transglutaminase domain-containing protein n=1 Tax=Paenibacillus sp. OV219 TaxID=1884377 RepID=UPI0008B1A5D7|nr:transglutaminase-like domain-containing protein [Paenibacillus sp. OV219]SEO17843.1 Transglutaminase-like superfamily protein [Paenibacillus sp. OV219]
MHSWFLPILKPEPVALMVLLILLVSIIQGMRRGAPRSAKHLFFFIWQAASVVLALVIAGKSATRLSPVIRDLLVARHIVVPQEELSSLKQLWYTFITSLRDFELLRFSALFLLIYAVVRSLLQFIEPLFEVIYDRLVRSEQATDHRQFSRIPQRKHSGTASRATGALLGALLGAGRAFLVIAILFVYVSLLPGAAGVDSIRASALYKKTAAEILTPVAGDVLKQGPVFSDAVQAEFRKVLERKYEVIDAAVPENIEAAAVKVTKNAHTDEEKARALYDWIGTRIVYDWDKANNYVNKGIWKEQTPIETFDTRKGVCIDVARLYAVMARSVGLDVKVVTGLGGTGSGGYGPHAWNEVKLADAGGKWIPLDATWASSGAWFNPKGFASSHIQQA